MTTTEKLKKLNGVRKYFKVLEDNCYDWDNTERYLRLKKKRKKIEKEIFELIDEL